MHHGPFSRAAEIYFGRKGGPMVAIVITVAAVIAFTVTITVRFKRR
jgi:hypothetical protein